MKKLVLLLAISILLPSLSGCLFEKGDRDGDGLPDDREKEGWDINVVYPKEKNITTYHVVSDPTKKDTDGDGLTDLEEFLYPGGKATDPTKKDTDGDGLTDLEEKNLGTDPTSWIHDIDKDGFIDYDEILYYQKQGISHEKILQYLQTSDVDVDGVLDGYDIDPLRDLKIKVWIKALIIKSSMDESDGNIEVTINVSTGEDWAEFPSGIPYYIVPVNKNESINFSCILDINDIGVPGNASSAFMIVIKDLDEGSEMKLIDTKDGIPQYDFVRVFSGNEAVYAVDFDIFTDCHAYHTGGVDGELWFEIIDVSEPVKS